MPQALTRISAVAFAALVLCFALGANDADKAHPIFTQLKVGQMIHMRWEQGGYIILSGGGGLKKIKELGSDYLAVTETGHTYYIYINQIKGVDIQPGFGGESS